MPGTQPYTAQDAIRSQVEGDILSVLESGTRYFDDDGAPISAVATCGACGRSWDDAVGSTLTPAPSGRCPFELLHDEPSKNATVIGRPDNRQDAQDAITDAIVNAMHVLRGDDLTLADMLRESMDSAERHYRDEAG